ncbi:MAG: hypothetical protein NTX49_07245, partial [Chlamydiae bacterium]|nr:hypothetical protein [Chlamydiota bacterium]
MSLISASSALVKIPERVIREEREVSSDIHYIAMQGQDISQLIHSSCSVSSTIPLERVVFKVLIAAGNTIEALNNLQYQEGHEFIHTYRTISSSPLKSIQHGVFAREVDRGIHSGRIAAEVSRALELIKGEYCANQGMIACALPSFAMLKEQELASLLYLPLNLKKLTQIQTELDDLTAAMEWLKSSNDTGSVDADYHEDPLVLIRKRLDGILNYVTLPFIVAELEKSDLSTPSDFDQFFSLTNTFEHRLYEWTQISRDIGRAYSAADYSFHTNGISFVQDLRGRCSDKFSTLLPLFSPIIERMKDLTERKRQAVFSEALGAAQEYMEAIDSEAFDIDKLFREAKNFIVRFSGTERSIQKQLVIIGCDIKRYLIDPLKQLKRALSDCFDLDSAESLIELKQEFLEAVRIHKALREKNADIEESAELIALYAFFERESERGLQSINSKLSSVVDDEIRERMSEMDAFLVEGERDSEWQNRMEAFCDRLSKIRNHRACFSLPELDRKRLEVEIRRIFWISSFAIEEGQPPETVEEMVASLRRNQALFQTYASELEAKGEIDPEVNSQIRASHSARIDLFSQWIVSSLIENTPKYGQRAVHYSQKRLSADLAREIAGTYKEYKDFKRYAISLLEGIEHGKDALNAALSQIGGLFSILLIEYSFRSYSDNPEKCMDRFLEKQKIFRGLQGEVLAEEFPSPYQSRLRERLMGVESLIRRDVENYVGIFTSSIITFSDEIDRYSAYSEPDRAAALADIGAKIQGLDEKYGKFMRESAFTSDNFGQLTLSMQNLKMQFQQGSLGGIPELLKALEDSILREVSTSSRQAESFYVERIQRFYSEHVLPKLFQVSEYSPVALYLVRERDVILGKLQSLFKGRIMGSPLEGIGS